VETLIMAQKPPPPKGNQASGKEAPRVRSFLLDDFPFIRRACIVFFVCVAIGAALVIGSGFLLEKQLDAKSRAQPLDNEAREKYSQAENEKREIHDFQPKYMELIAKGFIGEEKRLDWMESINRIQQQRALLPINYEISAQQVFPADPSMETGVMELHGSKMLVKMNLLHEMDLLNFLNDLKTKQAYSLHDCSIKRLKVNPLDQLAPRLYAECTLYWITLGKRAGADSGALQAGTITKEGQ
jgi:hypothetical protein